MPTSVLKEVKQRPAVLVGVLSLMLAAAMLAGEFLSHPRLEGAVSASDGYSMEEQSGR